MGTVYATVKEALSKVDLTHINVAALMTDVGVDCFIEGWAQCRDDIMDILLAAGVDSKILNQINNLKATDGA